MPESTIELPKRPGFPTHLPYLDGIRAVAALYVVAHHIWLQVNPNLLPPVLITKVVNKLLFHGHSAVSVFIVLSGFCLMLPIARGKELRPNGILEFFKRRAIRILPPYYFALAFSLALIFLLINQETGTHWDVSIPVTLKSIVTHLFLVHDAFGEEVTINHVLWSIAVEWRIYFLFPLLIWGWNLFGPFVTTGIALVSSYVLWHLNWIVIGHSLNANFLGLFALGMVAAMAAFSDKPLWISLRNFAWKWTTLGLTVLVLILLNVTFLDSASQTLWTDYVIGFWAMALLILVAVEPDNLVTKLLSFKPLVSIGVFSYSLYLIHAPLLQVFWQYLFIPLQNDPLAMMGALFVVGLPLCIAIAYLFYLACERPFIKKRQGTVSQVAIKGDVKL